MNSTLQFDGITWIDILDLGISQLYLSRQKLDAIQQWFDPHDLANFQPLPVHDFGSGRLTLTDGHSRAFTAHAAGLKRIPVIYDLDDIITCPAGQMLYRNDIVWCDRFGLHTVADLADRILSPDLYRILWNQRCDAGFNLLTKAPLEQQGLWSTRHSGLYLYGANEDLSILFFEDSEGKQYRFPAEEDK